MHECVLYLRKSPKTKDKFNIRLVEWLTQVSPFMVASGITIRITMITKFNTKALAARGITMTPALVPASSLLLDIPDSKKVFFGADAIVDFIQLSVQQHQQTTKQHVMVEQDEDSVHDMLCKVLAQKDEESDEYDINNTRRAMEERLKAMSTKPVTRSGASVSTISDTDFSSSISEPIDMLAETSNVRSVADMAGEIGMDDTMRKFWENRECTDM